MCCGRIPLLKTASDPCALSGNGNKDRRQTKQKRQPAVATTIGHGWFTRPAVEAARGEKKSNVVSNRRSKFSLGTEHQCKRLVWRWRLSNRRAVRTRRAKRRGARRVGVGSNPTGSPRCPLPYDLPVHQPRGIWRPVYAQKMALKTIGTLFRQAGQAIEGFGALLQGSGRELGKDGDHMFAEMVSLPSL